VKTTRILAICLISVLLVSAFTGLALGKKGCATIQDGTLLTSDGKVITTGYDE
jgi:hypothetical protein